MAVSLPYPALCACPNWSTKLFTLSTKWAARLSGLSWSPTRRSGIFTFMTAAQQNVYKLYTSTPSPSANAREKCSQLFYRHLASLPALHCLQLGQKVDIFYFVCWLKFNLRSKYFFIIFFAQLFLNVFWNFKVLPVFHFPYLSLSHSAILPLCQTQFAILFWSSLFAFACPQNFVQPTLLSRCYLFISWVCLSCRKIQASGKTSLVRKRENSRSILLSPWA